MSDKRGIQTTTMFHRFSKDVCHPIFEIYVSIQLSRPFASTKAV